MIYIIYHDLLSRSLWLSNFYFFCWGNIFWFWEGFALWSTSILQGFALWSTYPPFLQKCCLLKEGVALWSTSSGRILPYDLRLFWRGVASISAYLPYVFKYPLRRNDYQNNSVKILLCNCVGAITGCLCRAPENNSPNIFSCKSPCPVRAPPGLCPGMTEITEKSGSYRMRKIIPQEFYYVIAPGALTGFSCRAPKNNSKIIFPACNHFDWEGIVVFWKKGVALWSTCLRRLMPYDLRFCDRCAFDLPTCCDLSIWCLSFFIFYISFAVFVLTWLCWLNITTCLCKIKKRKTR